MDRQTDEQMDRWTDERTDGWMDGQIKWGVKLRSTRLNKAGYMVTPVACGWVGAVIKVNASFLGRSSEVRDCKTKK